MGMSASDIVSRDSAEAKESLAAWSASPDCVDWECRGLRLYKEKVYMEMHNCLLKGEIKAQRMDSTGPIKKTKQQQKKKKNGKESANTQ